MFSVFFEIYCTIIHSVFSSFRQHLRLRLSRIYQNRCVQKKQRGTHHWCLPLRESILVNFKCSASNHSHVPSFYSYFKIDKQYFVAILISMFHKCKIIFLSRLCFQHRSIHCKPKFIPSLMCSGIASFQTCSSRSKFCLTSDYKISLCSYPHQ